MTEFFLWFIRPVAEFLGAIVLFILVICGVYLFLGIQDWHERRMSKIHADRLAKLSDKEPK